MPRIPCQGYLPISRQPVQVGERKEPGGMDEHSNADKKMKRKIGERFWQKKQSLVTENRIQGNRAGNHGSGFKSEWLEGKVISRFYNLKCTEMVGCQYKNVQQTAGR